MAYFVLGKRKADFVNSDGKRITGFNFWLSEPIKPEFGEGVVVTKQWSDGSVDSIQYDDLQINKKCEVFFNSKGKPQKIVF